MNYRPLLCTVALACLSPLAAQASHHFESVIAQHNPAINQLDNYVFASPNGDSTVFISTFNPAPKAGPNGIFASDALYNIHIADDADYKTGTTFSFSFSADNTFTLYQLPEPNAAAGTKGKEVASGQIGQNKQLTDGIELWTGVVKDPFYGNSSSLGLFRAQLDAGKPYDPSIWAQAQGKSIFIGRQAAAIVLEVPNKLLGKTIRFFTTTAQEQDGKWTQVQYSANPLFSHTTLFENEALRAEHNQSRPNNESAITPLVSARTARASALAKTQADPLAYGDKIANLLVPDVLTYTVGTSAKYGVEQRNGRALDDDAMSVILTLLLGTPTDQKIDNPKLHTDKFPYLIEDPLK